MLYDLPQKQRQKLQRSWKRFSCGLHKPEPWLSTLARGCSVWTKPSKPHSSNCICIERPMAKVIYPVATSLCHFMVPFCKGYRNKLIPFPKTYWSWSDFFGVERFQEFWISFKLQTLFCDPQVPHSILKDRQKETTLLVSITKFTRLPIADFFPLKITWIALGGTRECNYLCYPCSSVSAEEKKKFYLELSAMPPSKPFTQMKDVPLS